MSRFRVFLAALIATVSFGLFIPPANAATYSAMCDTNRGGFAVTGAGFTGQTTAINNCIGQMDSSDGCWSGWVFWGTGGSGGATYTYKSRTKVASWWCGNNTTPVNIRVWVAYQ